MPVFEGKLEDVYERMDCRHISRSTMREFFIIHCMNKIKEGFELAPKTKEDLDYCKRQNPMLVI